MIVLIYVFDKVCLYGIGLVIIMLFLRFNCCFVKWMLVSCFGVLIEFVNLILFLWVKNVGNLFVWYLIIGMFFVFKYFIVLGKFKIDLVFV